MSKQQKLTKAQRRVLEWLNGGTYISRPSATMKALIRRSYIALADTQVGRAYKITPAGRQALEPWCPFCKKPHVGGDTCLGHHP